MSASEKKALTDKIEKLEDKLEKALAENERLRKELEEALRSLKRQAAPFSRNQPKADPKPPGRKSGHEYGARASRPVPAHQRDPPRAAARRMPPLRRTGGISRNQGAVSGRDCPRHDHPPLRCRNRPVLPVRPARPGTPSFTDVRRAGSSQRAVGAGSLDVVSPPEQGNGTVARAGGPHPEVELRAGDEPQRHLPRPGKDRQKGGSHLSAVVCDGPAQRCGLDG